MRELVPPTQPTAHSYELSSTVMILLDDSLRENKQLKDRVRELMARDLRLCQSTGLHAAEAHRWKLMTAGLFIAAVGLLCVVMLLAAG